MTFALAAGTEPVSGYRCIRRLSRSHASETWLVQAEDESYRALKWLYDSSRYSHLKRLTSIRHPFLIHWEKTETIGSDVLLLSEWAEESLDIVISERRHQGNTGSGDLPLLRYLEELGEVLDFLHQKQKLVHGRLKLSNVGILHRHIKLLDWGLCVPEQLTVQPWSPTEIQSTAPEVLTGQCTPASDQFSLAALFLIASQGNRITSARSLPELLSIQQRMMFSSEQLSSGVQAVLERALHRDPASRYSTCMEMVQALSTALQASENGGTQSSPSSQSRLNAPGPVIEEPIWNDEETPVAPSKSTPTVMIQSLMEVESDKGGNSNKHPDSAFLNLNNLAYHSKVQSSGVLTPTLLIGLGEYGKNILQKLSNLFQQRFEGISQLPNIRLLSIGNETIADSIHSKPGSLNSSQYFSLPSLTDELLHASCKNPIIQQWLPDSGGLMSVREADPECPYVNRLSLVRQYSRLRLKLAEECKIMMQSDSLIKARQHTGLSIRQDLTPTCYVIADLSEALATGTLADLIYLIRSVIAESGWGHGQLTGLFLLPGDTQSAEIKARTYAALVELNHYTQEQFFAARYNQEDELTYPFLPCDQVFFRKYPLQTGPHTIEEAQLDAAHWLLREVTSELSSLRLASRRTTDTFAPQTSTWFSHGMTALKSSHDDLKVLVKNRMLGGLIQTWLTPSPEVSEHIQKDFEQFLEQYIHSASALLERFQHMAAVVLGCEPSQLIEEWIAPLRKGAAARPPLETLAREIMHQVETNFGTSSSYQHSPALVAIQHEAESVALDISSKIKPFILQYLDQPGMRLGGSLYLGNLLLNWINHHVNQLQANHLEIHQDMLRAERTITQMMSQEERSFAIMGRQRLVSQIVQDLSDYPSRVLAEDMFARALHVFQHMKKTVEECLAQLQTAELNLKELQSYYQTPAVSNTHLLLDGAETLEDRVQALQSQLPEDLYLRLDSDMTVALSRFQSDFSSVCLGKGPNFTDVLELLDNSLEENLEGMLPSEDAAEQLLTLTSQTVVEQLRQCYRDARPDLMENKRTRQGAFCLMLTPGSDAGQELLQMAQATLPQIVAAPEGLQGEILFYRETGSLLPHEIYPEGSKAYEQLQANLETSQHSRFDISYWHSLGTPPDSVTTIYASSTDSLDTITV